MEKFKDSMVFIIQWWLLGFHPKIPVLNSRPVKVAVTVTEAVLL